MGMVGILKADSNHRVQRVLFTVGTLLAPQVS